MIIVTAPEQSPSLTPRRPANGHDTHYPMKPYTGHAQEIEQPPKDPTEHSRPGSTNKFPPKAHEGRNKSCKDSDKILSDFSFLFKAMLSKIDGTLDDMDVKALSKITDSFLNKR